MIYAFAPLGIKGKIVQVEVDIGGALPGVEIVGLPSSEVKEAKDRVKIGLRNSGFSWPKRRIFINLAPADVKKKGAGFDLPIALAILVVTKQIPEFESPVLAIGELQLNGNVRPVRGALPAIITALEQGIERFIAHRENTQECAVTRYGSYLSVHCLKDLQQARHWGRKAEGQDEDDNDEDIFNKRKQLSLADLSHCPYLKRAAQIAAGGRHNILFCGPPGTGKTASAIRISSLLPQLDFKDSLELSSLYSQNGHSLLNSGLITERPLRIPHHTASVEGMIGSSTTSSLGEISLAHHGILLLDEAPEFRGRVLQSLREPLDQHRVLISRAGQKWDCPADFQLVLTTNLCPCGNQGKPQNSGEWCLCSEQEVFRYWKKIGGALWDRIDIKFATSYRQTVVEESLTQRYHDMVQKKQAVIRAVEIQKERYRAAGLEDRWNARCPSEKLQLFRLSSEAHAALQTALSTLGISERRKAVLYRVSQTIADLAADDYITETHISEAVELVNFKPLSFFLEP